MQAQFGIATCVTRDVCTFHGSMQLQHGTFASDFMSLLQDIRVSRGDNGAIFVLAKDS